MADSKNNRIRIIKRDAGTSLPASSINERDLLEKRMRYTFKRECARLEKALPRFKVKLFDYLEERWDEGSSEFIHTGTGLPIDLFRCVLLGPGVGVEEWEESWWSVESNQPQIIWDSSQEFNTSAPMMIRFNDGTEFPMPELTDDHLSCCFNEWKNHWSEDLDGYFTDVKQTLGVIREHLWRQISDGEELVVFDSLLPPNVIRILWGQAERMCPECFHEPRTQLYVRTFDGDGEIELWVLCSVCLGDDELNCFRETDEDDLWYLLNEWSNLDEFFEDDWDNSVYHWIMGR